MAVAPIQRPGRATAECPRCGAEVEPLQEYCLDCGQRLAPPPDTRALITSFRPGSPWYAGAWVWPVLASLVVAVAVATAVVAYATTDDAPAADTLIATSPQATAPILEAPPESVPTAAPPPPPARTTGPVPAQPPPSPRAAGGLAEWPVDEDGFTVVLASLPKDAGRDAATARARAARKAGVEDVGVLDTDQFASLHPGYYVVFSGVHDSQADAERAAGDARDHGYDDAYPTAVAR